MKPAYSNFISIYRNNSSSELIIEFQHNYVESDCGKSNSVASTQATVVASIVMNVRDATILHSSLGMVLESAAEFEKELDKKVESVE